MEQRLKTGLVGAGVFAGYHASKIHNSETTDFSGVHDLDFARARGLAENYGCQVFDDLVGVLEASDAVIVASPATTHFEIGKQALDAGCHLLMEKPLALSAGRALQLATLAESKSLVLQVGHQERLVCKALGLFDVSDRPRSIEVVRAGPPPADGRAMDTGVIWDLMIHDIDLVHALVGEEIADVLCRGRAEIGVHLDEATAQYTIDGTSIKLAASRIAAERSRYMALTYEVGTIQLDFLSRTIRNTTPFAIADNLADLVPDPLGAADELFFAACTGYGNPLLTGREAARAVATAEILSRAASGRSA